MSSHISRLPDCSSVRDGILHICPKVSEDEELYIMSHLEYGEVIERVGKDYVLIELDTDDLPTGRMHYYIALRVGMIDI